MAFGASVGLLWYFGGSRLLSPTPHAGFDFDTHASQVWRVLEGLQHYGQPWVYDVQHLAGVPNGVIFDADNKGWELFTYGLTMLGLPPGLAFNLFIVAAHLAVAPVVYCSARLFDLPPRAAWIATMLAVLFWFFDAWNHWEWFVGMIAYGVAGYFFLLPLGAFYRWLEQRRFRHALLAAFTLAIAHLIHPYTFFILLPPMLALYLRQARSLQRHEHGIVGLIVGLTIGVNLYWLIPAMEFWPYIIDSSFFSDPALDSLVWDAFGLLGDPTAQGVIGNRTAIRSILVVGGIVGIYAWYRRHDRRTLPFGLGLVSLLLITYLGSYTVLSQIQPHRHVGPTGFLAIIPAAAAIELALRERLWASLSRGARMLVIVLAVPATQHIARDLLYFFAPSLPRPAKLLDGQRGWYSMMGFGPHGDFSYADWHHDELAAWVRAHDDGSARFLVESWHVGEQLTWKTNAQILGGFTWRNLQHSWANFFRRHPRGIAPSPVLDEYLRTYGVEWIIISTPADEAPWWDQNPIIEQVAELSPFRIYRSRTPHQLVAQGQARLTAQTNRIQVHDSHPAEDLVLRYHWLDTLRCRPNCSIDRVAVDPIDTVGFIRIPAPHPIDFEIYNAYQGL